MQPKVYYCNIDNFGDKLNEYIFKYFLGCDIRYSNIEHADIIGIGSLLDCILKDSSEKIIKKPIWIFSTGFGFEEGGFFHNKNIILPEKLKRNVKCYALRGKLTKARIENLTNSKEDVVLGDAGLLSSFLINKESIEKKYSLGIVPHFADSKNPIWRNIVKDVPGSVILDVTKNPVDFLEDLASCEAIISTAMHPLIAADSLGIPNMWVRISEETTSRYKFKDYYSVFDIDIEPYMLLEGLKNINKEFVVKNYQISEKKVSIIKKNLIRSMFIMEKDLNYLKVKDIFRNIFISIFSLRNEKHNNVKHKVLTILGIKFKFNRMIIEDFD